MLRRSFDLRRDAVLVVGLNISSALMVPKFEIVLCNSYACSMVVVPKVDVLTSVQLLKELAFVARSCIFIIKIYFLRRGRVNDTKENFTLAREDSLFVFMGFIWVLFKQYST